MLHRRFGLALMLSAFAVSFATTTLKASDRESESYEFCEIAGVEKPYRLLTGKDPAGYSLEMDDSSIWRIISSASAKTVKSWRVNDPLVLYPCFMPGVQGTKYYIYNERSRDFAYSELSYGPLLGTPTSLQLVYVDHSNGQVKMQDGAGRFYHYRVSNDGLQKLRTWKLNQSIIIGSNETWHSNWFSRYPYILINVDRDQFVSATLQ